LDEENLWSENRLWTQLAILEHYAEFGAVYGQFVASGLGEDFLWPEASAAPAGLDLKTFAWEESAAPSFLTVRRDVLTTLGTVDEGLDGLDDLDLCLRLAASTRIAFVTGPVGKIMVSRDSGWLSRMRRGEFQKELAVVLNRGLALLPENADKLESSRDVVSH